jgi:two-component system sensor histidine kinase KdpD
VALLYVLAVVVAAGFAGTMAGLLASVASFVALNFFFTHPLHTLAVGEPSDLIVLIVFLLVSVITGLLLSAAVEERLLAKRREVEARLLNEFTGRLLSGHALEDSLCRTCEQLVELLDLASCEITTNSSAAARTERDVAAGRPYDIALGRGEEASGRLRAVPRGRAKLDPTARTILQNVAGQLSLALESARLTNEMQRTQTEAERNRLRAALFSGVTHDLKTPLSAITASVTSLLASSELDEWDRREHLDTIRQEADHLNRLLTNLMDLSRLRAGALVPSPVPAAIDEIVESVIARLQPMLHDHPVDLNLKGDLPEMSLDVVQIDQVFTNLIENAAKFSSPGSPIRISAVGHAGAVRVSVTDRGPGIPREDRERVFQPFERGSGEATGTGLGLAIANAIVVSHGGRMWAQDAPSGGATLTFELPTSNGSDG